MTVGNTPGRFGNLTIQNGSTLTSNGAEHHIADGAGTNGVVTVTGAGSQWTVAGGGSIEVGAGGNGILNILSGGTVVAQSGVTFGTFAGGVGTINISGGSTLETSRLSRAGAGDGQVNFDDAILRARANNNFFIAGFSPGTLNIAAGGLTVDTQAFTVAAGSGFSGVGGLTKTGTGALNLRAVNTYTGDTVIQAGTLGLASNGSIATSSRVVANGTFGISGITAAGTSIQSLAGIGSVTLGAKNLTITDAKNDVFSGIISGSGTLTLTDGTQTFSGANAYTGATSVNGGTLRAGAANIFGTTSAFSVAAAGTFDVAGFNQTLVSLDNAGAVRLGGVAPGTTLTVTGNYAGNGGTVYLNTALGSDGSATDRLVAGSTSDTSSLVVTNVGGAGAQTGDAGIKVVDVLGASNGTFSLVGDYVFEGDQAVVGGAYAYRLYQGTETTADGDWYLRSEIIDAGPLYAPTVPLYENYANVLQTFNELGTLQQRVGSREWLNGGQQASDDGAVAPNAIWARMDASQAHFEPGVSTAGASYDVTTWRLQAGLDGVLHQSEAGSLVAGVNAQFGTVSSDITSIYGAGSVNALGFGVGGTLTWYGAGGLYVDGQAQVIRYEADIVSDDTGTTLVEGNDAFGYGLSLEAGQKIGLNDNWSLTPQAQLSYSAVRFNDFTDQYGGTVSLDDGGDTLVGRLGLSADYESEWQDAAGETKQTHLYGIGNLYYDFLDGSTVDVSGTKFASENQGVWGGVGVGGSLSWADAQYSVFGEALVRGSLDDFGNNNAIAAKVGFNGRW
ncbi:autotransporter outer membrane beta-barrel domain-containing protein [Devosia insulae DS-56]|uniref:Autotransporter outer membrane beta-barrel domain-containing protein n=1 Tax=Devosia insulae DS-56 TaxID=1116389 RepID=A0A1E5XKT3_9HYPH|nr:autotransporter outer membrane beta-barrel domain-containing protein [Devosia insulae DS-56]